MSINNFQLPAICDHCKRHLLNQIENSVVSGVLFCPHLPDFPGQGVLAVVKFSNYKVESFTLDGPIPYDKVDDRINEMRVLAKKFYGDDAKYH